MTMKSVYNPKTGTCERVLRSDAIKGHNPTRLYCPTTNETKWVSNLAEFRAAGGTTCFNEDQTEIELLLPEPYKFSIQFERADAHLETLKRYCAGFATLANNTKEEATKAFALENFNEMRALIDAIEAKAPQQ